MFTRFFERGIGRGGNQLPQLCPRLLINACWRTACARQLVGRAALALAAHEVAHRCRADAKEFTDLALRAMTALGGGDNLPAQVVGVGFHATYSDRLLLVNSTAYRSMYGVLKAVRVAPWNYRGDSLQDALNNHLYYIGMYNDLVPDLLKTRGGWMKWHRETIPFPRKV